MSRKGTEEYIIGRYCDEPMARSKGLLPCENDCKHCMACIEMTDTGEKQHCNIHRGDLKRKFIQASDEVEAWVMSRPVAWSKEDEELLELTSIVNGKTAPAANKPQCSLIKSPT